MPKPPWIVPPINSARPPDFMTVPAPELDALFAARAKYLRESQHAGQEEGVQGLRVLVFAWENLRLAVPEADLVQVLSAPRLLPVPRCPLPHLGLVVFRSTAYDVYSLPHLLGLSREASTPISHLALVRRAGQIFGLAMGSPTDFQGLNPAAATSVAAPDWPRPITTQFPGPLYLLDLGSLSISQDP